MNLLQSLAGSASGAMERLTATLAPKAEPTVETGSTAKDFATALAAAMNPEAEPTDVEGAISTATVALPEGEEGAVTAEGAALDAALAALMGAHDPTKVQRATDLLDPEFEAKLKRVIERMESEFGHKVQITETFRTQERQNFLYEQGRSRPGQVVTWTRASNHTLGRAADLVIDGSYDNPQGYARLAEIAAEEGLRTLGARDPGHVELPGGNRKSAPTFAAAGTAVEGKPAEAQTKWEPQLEVAPQPGRHIGLARVAQVARVAEVAQVAQVAQVARVATVANPAAPAIQGVTVLAAQSGAQTREASTSRSTAEAIQALQQAMGSHQGIAALRSELGRGATGNGEGSGEGDRSSRESFVQTEGSLMPRGTFQSAVNQVLATAGTSGAERAARILELQDGAAAGPMSHVTLRVDNPSGGEDRIRIDLRGTSVDARIDMSNVGEAERVSSRLGELRTTLERHGLEAESLKVRAATATRADAPDVPRLGIALTEADSSRGAGFRDGSHDSGSSREGWKESTQGQARRDPSDPRQRQRRYTPEKENA